jgi:Tfp pilus assembly protein PilN
MKNIDFLPEIYKQQGELRKARVWWGAVVVIFGTAIGLAAGAQFWLRQSIQRQLDSLQPQFAAAQSQVRELSSLNAQIVKAGRSASLITFLDNPWPRTQILAELVRPLPASVQLTRIQIGEEELLRTAPQAGARRRNARRDEDEGPQLTPVEQDLTQLRSDSERRQTFVDLEGSTQDVAQLHQYVSTIGRSALFASAQIKSLEVLPADKQLSQTNFTIRVVVRPGYAIQGGATATTGSPAVGSSAAAVSAPRLARGGNER